MTEKERLAQAFAQGALHAVGGEGQCVATGVTEFATTGTVVPRQRQDPFFQEGMLDHAEGCEREDCPYGRGTDGREGWLHGWRKAAGLALLLLLSLTVPIPAAVGPGLVITDFTVVPIPPDAPLCQRPYIFGGYHPQDEVPYWADCVIIGLGTVSFTTEVGKSYRVQLQFDSLSPHAVENSEDGWLLISPTIPGTGSVTNFQFGIPNYVGFIRIKQL